MRSRSITIFVLAVLVSVFFQSPIPLYILVVCVLLVWAIRDSAYGRRRLSHKDMYLTDAFTDDGSLTNLRGIPAEELLDDDHPNSFRKRQAEVNNTLAFQNNEGKGPHIPDA